MSKRFFIEPAAIGGGGDEVTLDGPEAHHLIHVMRTEVGTQAILFDGTGREYDAKVVAVERKTVRFELLSKNLVDRELAIDLTIAVALPKADRQKVLIEKLVELGVTRVIPLITDRTVVVAKSKSLNRLQRAVIEASKQCGRNRLMRIEESWKAVDLFMSDRFVGQKLIASTGTARSLHDVVASQTTNRQTTNRETTNRESIAKEESDVHRLSYVCAIGPEGGFTETEMLMAAEHRWQAITMGNRVLRAETAAIAIAAHLSIATDQRGAEKRSPASDSSHS